MPRTTYFWQAGSLPGVGAFPAGIAVTVDDDGRTVLDITPLALPPTDPQPTPVASPPDASPSSSSSRRLKAPALPIKETGE